MAIDGGPHIYIPPTWGVCHLLSRPQTEQVKTSLLVDRSQRDRLDVFRRSEVEEVLSRHCTQRLAASRTAGPEPLPGGTLRRTHHMEVEKNTVRKVKSSSKGPFSTSM